jgi:hypothetical protein
MKKIFKEIYNEFNVPINNEGGYIEMGGFTICLIVMVGIILILNHFGIIN